MKPLASDRNLNSSSSALGSDPPAGLLGKVLADQTWHGQVDGVGVNVSVAVGVGVADGPEVGELVAVGDGVASRLTAQLC